MVSALRVAARSMSDFDDDLQLDNWLNLTLSQPHDPVACGEMLMRAANGDTFAISDRPEITFPWRRTIAERLRDESKNCWRLTDSDGTVRDEPEHGTPMGLTDDEGVTEKSLTGDEWGEYLVNTTTTTPTSACSRGWFSGVRIFENKESGFLKKLAVTGALI
eukprot:scaffold5326_cov136-Isochrysis_galbana.AAC.5